VRAAIGGFEFSQIVQTFSGSPLAITGSACPTNPAQVTCEPTLNSGFSGSARTGKHWSGFGPNIVTSTGGTYSVTTGGVTTVTTVAPTGPFVTPVANLTGTTVPTGATVGSLVGTSYLPNYTFGNAPRTGAYGMTGPGLFSMDLSLRRSFALHFMESAKLNLQADMYNATNFVQFGTPNLQVGNASFSKPTVQSNNPRQMQGSVRFEF
jgi:hypothetical protein